MRLVSLDGASEMAITIAGYECPEDASKEDANWLEVDVSVRTPHGRGVSRVACMTTWNAVAFADWLDALGARRFGTPSIMLFGEPNLQFQASDQWAHQVMLLVYFILERPGEWEMDDASQQKSDRHYIGKMQIRVRSSALRMAAASLRAELHRFPIREPRT